MISCFSCGSLSAAPERTNAVKNLIHDVLIQGTEIWTVVITLETYPADNVYWPPNS